MWNFLLPRPAGAVEEGGWTDRFRLPGPQGDVERLLVVGDRLIAHGRFRLEGHDASLLSWTGRDWVELEGAEDLVATSAFAEGSKLLVGGTRRVNESDTSVVEWWDGANWHRWTPPDEATDCRPLALIQGAFYLTCSWSDASIQTSSLLRAADSGLMRYRLPEETALSAGLELDGQFLGVLRNRHSGDDGWSTRLVRPSGDSLVVVSPAVAIYASAACVAGSTVVLTQDGEFSAPEMHRWDGAEWMPYPTLGPRLARHVPVSDRDILYAQFEDSTGGSVGLWADDGGRGVWRRVPVDLQPSYGAVRSIVTLKSALVLGGSFRSVDHQGAAGVAVESPDGWRSTAPGLGPDNPVSDLVPGHDGFWCLGSFQSLGDLWSPGVAFWNGGAWSQVLAPPFDGPSVGSVVEDELWVLRSNASWRAEGDVAAARLQQGAWVVQPTDDRIARWQLSRLLRYAGRTIAVGEISMTDGSRGPLAEWSMGAWRPVESIPAGSAIAAEAWRGKLILAGRFRPDVQPYGSLGDLLAWDGLTWELLSPRPVIAGSRTLGNITDLAAHSDLLLIAGDFNYLGEVYSPGLAAWDGERVRPYAQPSVTSPRPRLIRRLLVHEGEVFATGEFVDAENRSVEGVYRWRGERWDPVGRIEGIVADMAVDHGRLYVAGFFGDFFRRDTYLLESRAILPGPDPGSAARALSLEPNPAVDHLRVLFSGSLPRGGRWFIHDVSGRTLAEGVLTPSQHGPRLISLGPEELDGMRLRSGVYFVEVRDGGLRHRERLVVVR